MIRHPCITSPRESPSGDAISPAPGTANSAPKCDARAFVVGLGANLGDRLASLERAGRCLERLGRVEGTASLWESDAVGPPQPRYWNSAVRIVGTLPPLAIVECLLVIEAELGRVRRVRWGARAIDLDLLWVEGEVSADPRAEVPHPRLVERSFAATPLLELVPGAIDPRSGRAIERVDAPLLTRVGIGREFPTRWELFDGVVPEV